MKKLLILFSSLMIITFSSSCVNVPRERCSSCGGTGKSNDTFDVIDGVASRRQCYSCLGTGDGNAWARTLLDPLGIGEAMSE